MPSSSSTPTSCWWLGAQSWQCNLFPQKLLHISAVSIFRKAQSSLSISLLQAVSSPRNLELSITASEQLLPCLPVFHIFPKCLWKGWWEIQGTGCRLFSVSGTWRLEIPAHLIFVLHGCFMFLFSSDERRSKRDGDLGWETSQFSGKLLSQGYFRTFPQAALEFFLWK